MTAFLRGPIGYRHLFGLTIEGKRGNNFYIRRPVARPREPSRFRTKLKPQRVCIADRENVCFHPPLPPARHQGPVKELHCHWAKIRNCDISIHPHTHIHTLHSLR